MQTKLPLLGQITNFLYSMLFMKLLFTFIGFTISTFLNKGKLSFLQFGWFYFIYILNTSFLHFFFCSFQVLGCHGPLANREPGRAFLPATAQAIQQLALGYSLNMWFFFSPGEWICCNYKMCFCLRFVRRYLNYVSICLPRCPGGMKDAHSMYLDLIIL